MYFLLPWYNGRPTIAYYIIQGVNFLFLLFCGLVTWYGDKYKDESFIYFIAFACSILFLEILLNAFKKLEETEKRLSRKPDNGT